MFTWICPQCGREVPPAYTECPDCSKKAAEQPAAAPPPPPPPAAPQYQPPQGYNPPAPEAQPHPPQQQQYAPPPPPYQAPPQYQQPQYQPPYQAQQYQPPPYQAPAPPRSGLPTWALALLFALAFIGAGLGVYSLVGGSRGTSAKPSAAVESPAAKPGAKINPYQKYIEISGVRFVEGKKKNSVDVRFIVTNHSGADIPDLGGNVTIWGRTRNAEEDAAGTFTFKTDLKGFESKDLTVPLTTKKEFIELPDWQNVSTDVQITSPE